MAPERDDGDASSGNSVHLRREHGHELRALLLLVVGEAARSLNSREVPGGIFFQRCSALIIGCGPSREEQNDKSAVARVLRHIEVA